MASDPLPLTSSRVPDHLPIVINHDIPEICGNYGAAEAEKRDVDVTIGEKKLYAHKKLLIARIPFFRVLFNSNMAECSSGEVDLSRFEHSTIKSLLDYAYTGRITISEENIQDLIMGADFLQMESVLQECGRFVLTRIRVDTALPLYYTYKAIKTDTINLFIQRFIDQNFVAISSTPEFYELPFDDLVAILQRDSLHIDDEKNVFDAVHRWIGFDNQRREHAERLIQCVRHCIPESLLEVVETSSWVRPNSECRGNVNNAKAFIRNDQAHNQTFKTSSRICNIPHELIFVFGGISEFERPSIAYYNWCTDEWTNGKHLPTARRIHAVAVVDKKIFTIGGAPGAVYTFDCNDFENNEWTKIPNLTTTRFESVAGVIDGKIIVAGGRNSPGNLSSVVMFDSSSTTPGWRLIRGMSKGRAEAAACVLNGKLYVIGGFGHEIWNDGECYDITTDSWTTIAPMSKRRMNLGVAVLYGQIYVVGGSDGGTPLREVERYDPGANSWTSLKRISIGRSGVALAVACGNMYMFGGYDGSDFLTSVEMYHPETDTWVERTPMNEHSGKVKVGVVLAPRSFLMPPPQSSPEVEDAIEEITRMTLGM